VAYGAATARATMADTALEVRSAPGAAACCACASGSNARGPKSTGAMFCPPSTHTRPLNPLSTARPAPIALRLPECFR